MVPFPIGLFQPGEMAYEIFRDHTTDPSLEEMTEAALRVLSRNPRGFFLFVEGEWQLLADQRGKGRHSGSAWHHPSFTTFLQEAALTMDIMQT